VADKLALFADRFRARADVYAVRWENTRTGTAGWMPAVAGGLRAWISDTRLHHGMSRANLLAPGHPLDR
jgi:hypothetical protein